MAVPKVAVIALVAIIAVPILLGYAMNLNEVSVTDYKASGESVNVTQLLQNGSGYSYTDANIYTLNTRFDQGYIPRVAVLPDYQSTSQNKSSMVMQHTDLSAGTLPSGDYLSRWQYFYFETDYDGIWATNGYTTAQIWDTQTNSQFAAMSRIHSFYWDSITKTISITYYPDGHQALQSLEWNITLNVDRYTYRFLDSYNTSGGSHPHYNWTGLLECAYVSTDPQAGDNRYVDLSAGFRITIPVKLNDDSLLNDSILNNNEVSLNLPDYPKNVLMTMDLNTITDSSYSLILELQGYGIFTDYYTLVKTTDSGGAHWSLNHGRPLYGLTLIADLYYESSRSSNTYQIFIDNSGIEFRYVGNWPTIIGYANYYQTYRYDVDYQYQIGGLKKINFWNDTPVMRVDASDYRAFEYPIIENQTYTPSDFKSNPSTTISSTVVYGSSLVFGSNTYTVTNGNITIGTHSVPVNGMVLDSVPNDQGNYDNRINGTKVSESANPAAITFNGQWSASISTTAQESYTYTKTEWIPGEFAWDGIDSNFLIVGLITCLGAFVALGIYARKSRSGGIIPLMIVTGCAAMVFFILI